MNKHEPELRRLRRSGVTMDEAARVLGLRMSSVKTYCAEIGLSKWETDAAMARRKRHDTIRQMYAVGAPVQDIAAAVGMPVSSVKVTAHSLGCSRTPREAALLRHGRRGGTVSTGV